MVTTIKSWTDSLNNAFSNQGDQAVQYREALLALKQIMVLAGWSVTRSSNSLVANTSDNWATSADIVYAAAGSAHSWVVLRAPVTWGNPGGVDRFHVCLDAINTSADTTPQAIDGTLATGDYTVGGTTLNRPTTTSTEHTRAAMTFLPLAAAAPMRWNALYNTDGDIFFFLKDSNAFFKMAYILHSPRAASGGIGDYRAMWFHLASATLNVFDPVDVAGLAQWRGWGTTGAAISTGTTAGWDSVPFEFTAWPTGAEGSSGSVPNGDVHQFWNGASSLLSRYLGACEDIRGAPINATFGTVNDGDADARRLVVCGALWLPLTAASLPLM